MCKFRATARNAAGLTFCFFFFNSNWNGAEVAARAALDALVTNDPLHQKNGPWDIASYDITL